MKTSEVSFDVSLDVVLLLLNLNTFTTLIWCFYYGLWIGNFLLENYGRDNVFKNGPKIFWEGPFKICELTRSICTNRIILCFSETVFYKLYSFHSWIPLDEKCPYLEFFWSVFSLIQSKCGKIRTRKTPNKETFHVVYSSSQIFFCWYIFEITLLTFWRRKWIIFSI